MTLEAKRIRPAGNRTDSKIIGAICEQSTATTADVLALGRRAEYAVRVTSQRIDGAVVARLYVNLSAAERSVRRAHDRGLAARLELVRLVPVVGDPEALLGGGDDE